MPRKGLFPPLHLTLSLIKQFSTSIDKGYVAFTYIKDFCPKLSVAKAYVFVESQVNIIIVCKELPEKVTVTVKAGWCSLFAVFRGSQGMIRLKRAC